MVEEQKYEEGDGMAVVCFRTNTIPDPIEFYPVAGMLSDGTIRAITQGLYTGLEALGDRTEIGGNMNYGLYASAPFTDEEAEKIFEKSNFKKF
jgi:hypothetical protein